MVKELVKKDLSNVKPDHYELGHDYKQLGTNERLNASIVYREINGFKFFDILVNINGRVFLMKPWSVYSPKTISIYNWSLQGVALDIIEQASK